MNNWQRTQRKFNTAMVVALTLISSLVGSVVAIANTTTTVAMMCPFCSAVKQTLSEEMLTTDAVVLAEVIGPGKPQPGSETTAMLDLMMELKITQVIKGKRLVTEGKSFTTVVPPSFKAGQECLVMGVVTDQLSWSTPVKMTQRSRDYVMQLQKLPEDGPKRLAFFLDYLEDPESLLAYDAYDEFARAPYETVKALKDQMDRPQLIKWITDSEVTINRKRLYYTMLGVCGKTEDLALLERLITSDDKRERAALDALSACYLTLAGEKGVKLIEDEFLRDKNAEYVDTYSAVAALRFHGTESDIVPLPRILAALRLLLDRPDIADLVIPDLARWEDWSVIDRLVQMFKDADDDSKWVRVPIINYLRECPKPEAAEKIEELRKVDPQSVRRALLFFDAGPSLESDDSDFDSQLDQLDKEMNDNEMSDGGKDSASESKDTADKDSGEKKGTEKKADQADSSPQTALRPIVPNVDVVTLDADQMLQADPYAQPIGTTIDEESQASLIPTSAPSGPELDGSELTGSGPNIELVDDQMAVSTSTPELTSNSPKADNQPTIHAANQNDSGRDDSENAVETEIRTAAQATTDQRTASSRPIVDPASATASVSGSTTDLPKSYTWWMIGIPVAMNLILLVLAWSIFSGTFSRLFC